jgi:hypothetical protein
MIRQILDELPEQKRRLLMYAFEHDLGQYVQLDGGKFVGVNIQNIRNLQITESAGKWAVGIVKGKT